MRHIVLLSLLLAQNPTTAPVTFTGNVPLVTGPQGPQGPAGPQGPPGSGAGSALPPMPALDGNYLLLSNVKGNLSNVNWVSVQDPLMVQQGPGGLTLTASFPTVFVSVGKSLIVSGVPLDTDGGLTLGAAGSVANIYFVSSAGAIVGQGPNWQAVDNRILPLPGFKFSAPVIVGWYPR